MSNLFEVLGSLGLGLATNAIYDLLKVTAEKPMPKARLEAAMQDRINLHGVKMTAATVIEALASRGYLSIQGSDLYAPTALAFGSISGGAIVGDGSVMRTDRSATVAGPGAFAETVGNAQIRHNPDGSISFHVGEEPGSHIAFKNRDPK